MAGKRRRSSKNKEKKEKGIPYFDYNLLFIVIFLLCFGLVMLYSSSAYTSAIKNHDSMHYLKLQIRNIVLGLIPMVFLAKVDYRYWKKLGFFAYIASLILCVLVFVPKIGSSSHGSSRWIGIGPIQFQPSEVAKIAVILFMAMIIDKIPKQFDKFLSLVKVLAMLIPLIIVVAISNLSTAVIIIGISVCMLFVASPKYLHIALELLRQYEKKDWQEVIPDAEFPAPLVLESNIEYVRCVLGSTVNDTACRERYVDVRTNAPETFIRYQRLVNDPVRNVMSHTFIEDYIRKNGEDYRFEVAPNPVPELRDRTKDNICVGRQPLCRNRY